MVSQPGARAPRRAAEVRRRRRASERRLTHAAAHDSLTGLANRTQLLNVLDECLAGGAAAAVLFVDLDRFKAINDTYGLLAGEQVLKEIANTLSTMLRDYDLAGRFGGEEFSLLLPQTKAVNAFRIAERIRSSIAAMSVIAPGAVGGERVQVTVSIGVAALDAGTDRTFSQLMSAADAALYRAKGGGRDQVQMISTTRGLSAVSGASRGLNGAVRDDPASAEPPSVFRRALTS